MIISYPSDDYIEKANRYNVCKLYRLLRSPETKSEIKKMNRICERFKEIGGFTSAISKSVGWE